MPSVTTDKSRFDVDTIHRFLSRDAYWSLDIPRERVDAAMRAINHSLGKGMRPEDVPTFAARSYCPELQPTPAISGLYNSTPAAALVMQEMPSTSTPSIASIAASILP